MLLKTKHNLFNRFDVKLTSYYTLALMVFAIVISAFFFYRLEHNLYKQIDRLLLDEANELLLEIKEDGGIIAGCQGFAEDVLHRKFYPIVYRALKITGEVIWQPENTPEKLFPSATNKVHYFNRFINQNKTGSYRIYEIPVHAEDNHEKFILQIGTPTLRSHKILENSLENIFSVLPVALIASILTGMIIAQKPRKLLQHIIQITNRITSHNLAERLDLPDGRDEIRELTITINSMLDRIENAFQEIKQFTSDVSHELRNPLSAIKGEIEVSLNRKREEAEYVEALYNCLEKTNDLIKMVNDLFLISRYDTNKYDLELEPLNFVDMLQGMYEFFLPMAQEKHIQFTIKQRGTGSLAADKTKILRLLNNLLDNAVKFTPENGAITIDLEMTQNDVVLSVEDNGIGIPEKDFDKIFNRFYQVDPSRSGKNNGAGLGLHICKKIVEAHNGSIHVKQNPTKGVTFTVTLPIKS